MVAQSQIISTPDLFTRSLTVANTVCLKKNHKNRVDEECSLAGSSPRSYRFVIQRCAVPEVLALTAFDRFLFCKFHPPYSDSHEI